MGFDLCAKLLLNIDPATGTPFIYGTKNGDLVRIPFNPEQHVVPEQFCKYLEQQGDHFVLYVSHFINFNNFVQQVSCEEFLEHYPDWTFYNLKKEFEGYDWTKADHDGFKEFLKWTTNTDSSYFLGWVICWSY